jgi:hypothetical protein
VLKLADFLDVLDVIDEQEKIAAERKALTRGLDADGIVYPENSAPTFKRPSLDTQLDKLKKLMSKKAMGTTMRGIAQSLSPAKGGGGSLGKGLGRISQKAKLPALTGNPNTGATAGVTINAGGGVKLKSGVNNPVGTNVPSGATLPKSTSGMGTINQKVAKVRARVVAKKKKKKSKDFLRTLLRN